MSHLVFVYGTLRVNQPNAHLLEHATLIIQNAWTYGSLFSTDKYYPILIQSSEDKVFGDVYEITEKELGLLDELEGYYGPDAENLYNRYKQNVYKEGQNVTAWVYTIHSDNEWMKRQNISHGDWVFYKDNMK